METWYLWLQCRSNEILVAKDVARASSTNKALGMKIYIGFSKIGRQVRVGQFGGTVPRKWLGTRYWSDAKEPHALGSM